MPLTGTSTPIATHASPVTCNFRLKRAQSEQALHVDTRITNGLIRSIRALGERVAVELKQH